MAGPVPAQNLWERLVLPGDLTASHAHLQSECSNCHKSFRKGAQSELCADCHREVAADVAAGRGYHGRAAEAKDVACSHCHTDHQGRGAVIVDLDPVVFDHAQTDFALVGAHKGVDCAGCHVADRPPRVTPTACVSCHLDVEPHKGRLGDECAQCHEATRWTEVGRFDHDKTKFPLKGAHAETGCADCHVNEQFAGLPKDCVACHRIDDVHENRFGPACADCHSETKWAEVRFDHDRDTDFALLGKHEKAKCADCHTENVKEKKTPTDCVGCHREDDVHRGSLGADCGACHRAEGWATSVKFDHDFTNFPLIGLHKPVPCEECHADQTFRIAAAKCVDCHTDKDVHKGRLGPDCATCHNPNGWQRWLFDHDTQTRFRLTGAHSDLACAACHGTVGSKPPMTCIACHRKDDVHKGAFGTRCSLCHSTATFKGARLK